MEKLTDILKEADACLEAIGQGVKVVAEERRRKKKTNDIDRLEKELGAVEFRVTCHARGIQRQLNDLEDSIDVKISEAIGEAMDRMEKQKGVQWVSMEECEPDDPEAEYIVRHSEDKNILGLAFSLKGKWSSLEDFSTIPMQSFREVTPLAPLLKDRDKHIEALKKCNSERARDLAEARVNSFDEGYGEGRKEALKELENEWKPLEEVEGVSGMLYIARSNADDRPTIIEYDDGWRTIGATWLLRYPSTWEAKSVGKVL